MRRPLALLAATAVAVAGAAACGGGDGGDEATVKKKKSPETTTTTTAPPPPPVAPLTGVVDPSGAALTRPVLTVKIENAPEARPQAGLELADVVYEEVVEGGITRFVVMYNSIVPDVVGPVRSVRDMDPYIVWPLGGVFAYSGGAPGPDAAIREAPVNPVDESATGTAMFRDGGRAAPHNLFGYGQALFDRGGAPVPPPALFRYLAPGETIVGEPVLSARVGFQAGYDPTWTYDPPTNTWLRSYGADPFVTASGAQVAPVNVVVQFIHYPGYSQGDTIGGGDVFVFSGGQLVRGKWLRGAREETTLFVDAAGNPIKLTPGPTWVELVPVGAPVDVVAAPAPPPPPPPPPTTAPPPTSEKSKKKNKDGDD
jgi:Protein of unknown function (DUF3048) N-terminal domain/Protein of unknown function (DUF3048) C-terminal domain